MAVLRDYRFLNNVMYAAVFTFSNVKGILGETSVMRVNMFANNDLNSVTSEYSLINYYRNELTH